MPSMPSGLPRSVMTWVSQISVSVGATLIATMIYGALPKVTIPSLEPAPEMTSGGKFAARALPSEALLVFDGLDAMPLPQSTLPQPVLPAAFITTSARAEAAVPLAAASIATVPVIGPMRRIVGDGGPIERSVKPGKALRPPLRADAKRPARLVVAQSAASEPVARVLPEEPAARAASGWIPRVVSTARDAWAVTASASDSLLARVVPQIP